MAHYDSLTGLANRFTFNEALKKCCADVDERNTFAVLYVDLDNFKHVNDSMGHDAGDKLLLAVADRLREHRGQAATCWRGSAATSSC